MRGEYLCGCRIDDKAGYVMFVDHQGNSTSYQKDREGYTICPEHGQREYGWKSMLIQTKNGEKEDFTNMGENRPLKISMVGVIDQRDNRDPELVYEALMLEKQQHSQSENGVAS
jgi:hypothetical protein